MRYGYNKVYGKELIDKNLRVVGELITYDIKQAKEQIIEALRKDIEKLPFDIVRDFDAEGNTVVRVSLGLTDLMEGS